MTHHIGTASLIAFAATASIATSALLYPLAAQEQQAAPQTPPAAYRPGMGDFMTAGIQPRHIKLAAAGQQGNWDYAAYALKEMGESFGRITRTLPNYRGTPTAQLIDSAVKEPMAAVDAAIKAHDAKKFKAAYQQLTDGCNSCHQKTERAMVVIQVPNSVTSYPDQNFRPAKR